MGNLLRSIKWTVSSIDQFLLEEADQEVKSLKAQGKRILCIWDGSVVEKPESRAAEGLCPVTSSKSKRLSRSSKGLVFNMPAKRPIMVAGMQWTGALIAGMEGTIKVAFDDAVMRRKLALNPVRDAEPPRKEERDMQVLDVTQAQKLLEVAKGTRLDCLLHLALLGLRRGELLGLRWQDINFEKRELRVARSLSYIQDPETRLHEFVLDTPKNSSSRRVLTLPQFILDSLYEHRAAQQEIRTHVHKWQELNIVFCTRFGGYMNPNGMVDDFDKLLKKADLPDIRFHDLRHSAATIWIALGVSPNVIQELLGHQNIVTTLGIYGHVLPTMHKQAIDHLDELFGKKPDEGDIK